MKKILFAISALALTAAPALAKGILPVDPATQPVPAGEYDQLMKEYNAFIVCLDEPAGRLSQVSGRGELKTLNPALGTAQVANAKSNNEVFQKQAEIVRTEIERVGPVYDCKVEIKRPKPLRPLR